MALLDLPLHVWQDTIMPKLGLPELNALRLTCRTLHKVSAELLDLISFQSFNYL
jgi:hypothetical protein